MLTNLRCLIDDHQLTTVTGPAKRLLKSSALRESCFILPGKNVFIYKVLPSINVPLAQNSGFPVEYFVALHKVTSAPGPTYPAYTPNHRGARIPLQHTRLNIPRWRRHLIGYENADITQFLEFGFPIGLADDLPVSLSPTLRNHGSSYQYFTYLDEFLSTGLERCELAGPFRISPFPEVHVSPLMTAAKSQTVGGLSSMLPLEKCPSTAAHHRIIFIPALFIGFS